MIIIVLIMLPMAGIIMNGLRPCTSDRLPYIGETNMAGSPLAKLVYRIQ